MMKIVKLNVALVVCSAFIGIHTKLRLNREKVDFEKTYTNVLSKNYLTDSTNLNTLESNISKIPIIKNDDDSYSSFNKQESKSDLVSTQDYTKKILKYPVSNETNLIEGYIGISKKFPIDDPSDNVFNINLLTIPEGKIAVLSYELFGVNGIDGVSRSVNQHSAKGGYEVVLNNSWLEIKEKINADDLQIGENSILFSVPKNSIHGYQVRNLKIDFEDNKDLFFLNQGKVRYEKNDKIYLSGFVQNRSKNQYLQIGNTQVPIKDGNFEAFVELSALDKQQKFIPITLVDEQKVIDSKFIWLEENLIQSDYQYPIEKSAGETHKVLYSQKAKEIKLANAQLQIPQGALKTDATISIAPLRSIDLPPLDAGMINVTKGAYAYRFLPHGTQFEKEVSVKISYDSEKLPSGYTEKDIQTYFFNEKTRHWESLKKDSADVNNKVIISSTTHFTDMINGVIQVPESPQTNSFTPTMMNDIKAADSSASVSIVQPPQANQKGTANISFPFNIPNGRNGMQPQLGLQYNNEGSSSFVGYGWSMQSSSITLDTRWGAPLFDSASETEIYTIDGEQLVYPKTNTSDDGPYMPNRHRLTQSGNYTTELQSRNSNNTKYFTFRKKGSFAKIERFGNTPQTYRWIVTDENGTKSYYGGNESAVNDDTVLKSSSGIFQWVLYKVEDKYGNNIQYNYTKEYNNIYLQNVYYTGDRESRGNYQVSFTYTTRNGDPNINGKNGVYQKETKRLDRIAVSYVQEPIRSYKLNYQPGKFEKNLLLSVTEYGENGDLVPGFTHTFEYYDEGSLFQGSIRMEVPCPENPDCSGDDPDQDGVGSDCDNCGKVFNANQLDSDGDGIGDACDECPNDPRNRCNLVICGGKDSDNDGINDLCDNCPSLYNPTQADADGNGIGDRCENTKSCYEVSFPIPVINTQLNRIRLNISYNYIRSQCFYLPIRVNTFTVNGSNYNAPNNLFYIFGNQNGSINKCPADTNYANASIGTVWPLDNYNDFDLRSYPWVSSVLNSTIGSSNYFDLVTSSSNSLIPSNINMSTLTKWHEVGDPFSSIISHNMCYEFYTTSNSDFNLTLYDARGYGIVPDVNKDITTSNVITGLNTPIFVNGISIGVNPYNIYNNFSAFKTAFESQYSNSTVSSDDSTVYIHFYKTPTSYSTIKVGDNVYNFEKVQCYDLKPSATKPSDWSYVKPSKEEIETAIKKWEVENEETLLKREEDQKMDFSFDLTGNKTNPELSGIYLYHHDSKTVNHWTAEKGKSVDGFTALKLDNQFSKSINESVTRDLEDCKKALKERLEKQKQDLIQSGKVSFEDLSQNAWKGFEKQSSIDSKIASNKFASRPVINIPSKPASSQLKKLPFQKSKLSKRNNLDSDGETCWDWVDVPMPIGTIPISGSFLGGSKTTTVTGGGAVGLGIGWNPVSMDGTFRWGFNWNSSTSISKAAQVDMNGDGLEDMVYESNGKIYYKPHSITRSYDLDGNLQISHSFGSPIKLVNINQIYYSKGNGFSSNLQFSISAIVVGAFVGSSKNSTDTETVIYITDANGDQLPDISVNGTVLFNKLVNNVPTFYAHSDVTENMVILAAEAQKLSTDIYNPDEFVSPKFDIVKVWESPKDGFINIKNNWKKDSTHKVSIETQNNVNNYESYGYPNANTEGNCRLYKGSPDLISDVIDSLPSESLSLGCNNKVAAVCDLDLKTKGNQGVYYVEVDLGDAIGQVTLHPVPHDVPDKYELLWKNDAPTTGFVSDALNPTSIQIPTGSFTMNKYYYDFNTGLFQQNANEIETIVNTQSHAYPADNDISINKTSALPHIVTIRVTGNPNQSTNWDLTLNCGEIPTLQKSTPVILTDFSKNSKVFSSGNKKYFTYDVSEISAKTSGKYTFQSENGNASWLISNKPVVEKALIEHLNFLFKEVIQNIDNIPAEISEQFQNEIIKPAPKKKTEAGNGIYVKKGQKIFFRLHESNDSSELNWNPAINFVNEPISLDENALDSNNSSYEEGFILNSTDGTEIPAQTGATTTAVVSWDEFTAYANSTLSDDVTIELIKQTVPKENQNGTQPVVTETVISPFPLVFTAGNTINLPANTINLPLTNNTGNVGSETLDTFKFRIKSKSNIDWKHLTGWKPEINVKNTITQGVSEPVVVEQKIYPIIQYDLYHQVNADYHYSNGESESNNGSVSISNNSGSLISNLNLNAFGANTSDFGIDNTFPAFIDVVIKQFGRKINSGKIIFSKNNANVNISSQANISLSGIQSNQSFSIELYGNGHPYITDLLKAIDNPVSNQNYNNSLFSIGSANYYRPQTQLYNKDKKPLGDFYRNWGQMGYSADTDTDTTPSDDFGKLINPKKLIVDANASQSTLQNIYDTIINFNPNDFSEGTFNENNSTNFENLQNAFNNAMSTMTVVPLFPYRGHKSGYNVSLPDLTAGEVVERWKGFSIDNYAGLKTLQVKSSAQSVSDPYVDEMITNSQAVLDTGAYSFNKISVSKVKSFTGGGSVSAGVASVGVGGTWINNSDSPETRNLNEYTDINGDGYPDLVTVNSAQLTNATGGLRKANNAPVITSHNLRIGDYDIIKSGGFNASGNYIDPTPPSGSTGGNGSTKKLTFFAPKSSSGAGISASFNKSEDEAKHFWYDINGDGLLDKLYTSGTNLLNLGSVSQMTSLDANGTSFGNFQLSKNESESFGGGLGVNFWNGSLEAGVSINSGVSSTIATIIDINGDGLPDYVERDRDNLKVKFNQGDRFSNSWTLIEDFNLDESAATQERSFNTGASFAVLWPVFSWLGIPPFKIPAVNANGDFSTSSNKTLKSITDYDGDGYPDLLFAIGNSFVGVKYSNIRRTNMLKTVTNPLGGKFTIDYDVKGNTYDLPQSKWVMTKVVVEDGYTPDTQNAETDLDGFDKYTKYFDYHNGKYDRRERDFYGFETVRTIDAIPSYNGFSTPTSQDVYSQNVVKYFNKSYYLNGDVSESWFVKGDFTIASDGSYRIPTNQIFTYSKNNYELYLPDYFNPSVPHIKRSNNQVPLTYDVGGKEGRGSAYVTLASTLNYNYNLEANPLTSKQEFSYDSYGRVITFKNSALNGNYISTVEYFSADSGDPNYNSDYQSAFENYNIVTIPKTIKVYLGTAVNESRLVRKREVSYVNDRGQISEIGTYLGKDTDGNDQGVSLTNMKYNAYGLLGVIIYPENQNGERLQLEYEYDNDVNSYVQSITSSVLNASSPFMDYISTNINFNPKYGVFGGITDITGNTTTYNYDDFGRISSILSPKDTNENYTINFNYFPTYESAMGVEGITEENFLPFAITHHLDKDNPGNDIETITIMDGLARPIQVKKDIAYYNGRSTLENMSVSGWVKYDSFGRAVEQFHPTYEDKDVSINAIVNSTETQYSSKTFYDAADRVIKQVDPAGTETLTTYLRSSDYMATVQKTNNNGQVIQNEVYTDVNGRKAVTASVGTSGNISTNFTYDEIGQLLTVDNNGNITTSKYDMAGRRIYMKHPDAGENKYWYDSAGNLTNSQTPVLSDLNQKIEYFYQYNRLTNIKFPDLQNGNPNPSNVEYNFGESGNETGRLVAQSDATGGQRFEYDEMGSVIAAGRVIVPPNPDQIPVSFSQYFTYDSWNRIKTMTYPDGEQLLYNYDLGGNLRSLENDEGNFYIKNIGYDEYEQKVYQLFGNNTENNYSYEPELRRLKNMLAFTATGHVMFNDTYSFDKVGNITQLENEADPNPTNNIGGRYIHNYSYDKLNRLVGASGNFEGSSIANISGNHQADYSMSMGYDNMHRIITKNQVHNRDGAIFQDNSYINNYVYDNIQPHAVDAINGINGTGDHRFEYDLNGNMLAHAGPNIEREQFWDEANRLRTVVDYGEQKMNHYIYDAEGQRILKGNGGIEGVYQNGTIVQETAWMGNYTMYPSGYVVRDARGTITKHYYNGSERVASRINDSRIALPTSQDTLQSKLKVEVLRNGITELFLKDIAKNKSKLELKFIPQEAQKNDTENADSFQRSALYYFHPDHLGSATYLSDANGNPHQFFLNLPFGETMAEQKAGSFDNHYKFNGKELDSETGYYYYGARYYDPNTSVWLNIDPLAEAMPSWSPYAYALNNPIRFVDPTGMAPEQIDPREFNRTADAKNKLAMREFVHTKEGQSFFAKYAKAGDEIGGVKFTQDGEYHKQGVDIKVTTDVSTGGASGEADSSIKNGRLGFTMSIGNGKSFISNGIENIGHESFIHILPQTKDFLDNGKFDFSSGFDKGAINFLKSNYKNIDGNHNGYGWIDHFSEKSSNTARDKYISPILNQYFKRINKNVSQKDINSSVGGFVIGADLSDKAINYIRARNGK